METPTNDETSDRSSKRPDDVARRPERVGGAELVAHDAPAPEVEAETVSQPAKVMRIGSMVKQLLDEVRSTTLDEPSRERLAEIYERSVVEVAEALSPDLQEELRNLTLPFRDGEIPSEAELRVAKAQLVGWLEGLFHGIQATLFAQQIAARQQLEQMRSLPPGASPLRDAQRDGQRDAHGGERPGTYL
jgi:hypothetical protein